MNNPLDMSSNVILITGGAQGIGAATARLCAQRGASVMIVDYKADVGEAAAERMRQEGLRVEFCQADVRNPEQVKSAVEQTLSKFGKLDRMLCAAGVLLGPWQSPEELSVEDFQTTIDINVKGVFLCAKYATEHLAAQKGVMVVVASGAGVTAPSSSLAYGASKGGANGLGMTLEAHLRDKGVRVNVICPGNIVTEMKLSVDIAAAQRKGEPVEKAIQHAEQHYGVPEGVARIIAFMLSEEADYLRGALFTR